METTVLPSFKEIETKVHPKSSSDHQYSMKELVENPVKPHFQASYGPQSPQMHRLSQKFGKHNFSKPVINLLNFKNIGCQVFMF